MITTMEVIRCLIGRGQWREMVRSYWARWSLKSPACRLFTQPFVRAQISENIKAPSHRPLWGELTGQLVNSPHNNAEDISIWWRHRERKASGICFPKVVYLSKAAILVQSSLKRKCHFEEIIFSCCTGSRESMCSWQRRFESGMHGNLKSSGKSCVAKQFTWCLGIALSDRSSLLSTFNPISVESLLIFNRTQCVVWKWFKGYKSRFCKTRYIHCGEIMYMMNSHPLPPPHPHTPTPHIPTPTP